MSTLQQHSNLIAHHQIIMYNWEEWGARADSIMTVEKHYNSKVGNLAKFN